MKKLNITQVAPFYPPALGGVENVIYNQARYLTHLGHRVTVTTSDYADTRALHKLADFSDPDFVVRSPAQFHLGTRPISLPLLPTLLRQKADIFHLHANKHYFNEVAALAALLKNKPFVWNPHAGQFGSSLIGRLYNSSVGKLSSRADLVIADSHFEKELLLRSGIRFRRMEVLPVGINLEEFPEHIHQSRAPIILTVCRLSEHKGLDTLIKTASRVVKKIKDAQFVIVGPDAGYGSTLGKQIRSHHLTHHITIAGAVSREDLLDHYRKAALFFLPSRSEAFGIVYLEALAAGLPIVASQGLATEEIIASSGSGILIDNGSEKDYADAIVSILQSSKVSRQLSHSARQRAADYSWNTVISKLEKFYREILG